MIERNRSIISLFFCFAVLVNIVSGCGPITLTENTKQETSTAAYATIQTILTPFPKENAAITTSVPPESTTPPVLESSPTPSSTACLQDARNRILDRMQAYGYVQEEYLSDAYWRRLASRIEKYGTARNILTLELHGDNYYMYGGSYSLTPESFYAQVQYLMEEDYHFATLHEIEGFVYGDLELPARSIIITTDLSATTVESLYSITNSFQQLEKSYGYKPHMVAFPWTGNMDEQPGIACEQDSCWKALMDAKLSGFFTFGSHSTDHPDFRKYSKEYLKSDLQNSLWIMEEKMGINTYALAWPFEACSDSISSLKEIGISLAWGGYSKPLDRNFTAWEDPDPFCLPRLFPPAPNGISMRPDGKTLQQMLDAVLSAP